MKQKRIQSITSWMHTLVLMILLLVPLHAPLTVWLASMGFNYDLVRLWKEAILILLLLGCVYLLMVKPRVREELRQNRLLQLVVVFSLLALLSAGIGMLQGQTVPKAIGFGLIVDTRMLLFMAVIMVLARVQVRPKIPQAVLLVAVGVVSFGLLQQAVLPPDFLKHLGYSNDTIQAYQAVDNNPNFVRIQSTLRGPNPLGAYLIPVVMLFVVAIRRYPRYRAQWVTGIVASLTVLFGTYSRSAWIGMAVTISVFAFWHWHNKLRPLYLVTALALVCVFGLGVYAGRDNDFVQNVIFHSSEKSPSSTSSNEQRAGALQDGLTDIATQPLGGGIGTAGPASFQNDQSRIAENFYIQIGQELGVLGLAVYVWITVLIGRELWLRRRYAVVQAVFAAFIGLIVVNLVSHAWSDDTLAYVFGGLLGYCLTAYKPSTKSE